MFKRLYIVFIFLSISSIAQINAGRLQNVLRDSVQSPNPESVPDSLKIFTPLINDYNKWNINESKVNLDTTLNIINYYKQNVYHKDLFEYQLPSNWGKSLIPLSIIKNNKFRFTPYRKQVLLIPSEEIYYYDVKTPVTRFIFENGVSEGQYLSSLFTHNPNKLINYAIQFNSLRSQGFFQRELQSVKNFSVSTNYHTNSNRYNLKANFQNQKIKGDENAGLDSLSIDAYVSNNPDFSDVSRLTSNLKDTGTELNSKSFYLNHSFGLFKIGKDSIQPYPLKLKHIFEYKNNEFIYNEGTDEPYYTYNEFEVEERKAQKSYKEFSNKISIEFDLNDKLLLDAGLIYRLEQPYFDELINKSFDLPERVSENRYGIIGNAKYQWKNNISVLAKAELTNGNEFGAQYNISGELNGVFPNLFQLKAKLNFSSKLPSYNYILNQSFYQAFNFYNKNFKNENIQDLEAQLKIDRLSITAFGGFTNIINYTYLNEDQLPKQSTATVNAFKIGGEHHYKRKYFHNILRIQYQKFTSGSSVYPIPDLIGRLTTYYQSPVFQKKAELQAGINIKYNSSYKARLYSPILNEFYLQPKGKEESVGNYPQLDVFANIKVRTMRIYLRAENLTSFILSGENLITPNQPFRNFKFQIGLHWTLFN